MRSKKLSQDVLAILSTMAIEGNVARIVDQLDRKQYSAVNDTLVALGGKWDRKAKGYVFRDDAAERIDLAILTGEVERPQDFGFFPTPPALIQRLMREVGLEDGDWVLEPSAGQGALIVAAYEAASVKVLAFELLEANHAILKDRFGMRLTRLSHGDFLAAEPNCEVDRVIMNPPFAKQQDIAHVMRAWQWLRRGGRLAAIMSGGVAFRQDAKAKAFRAFVQDNGGTIEELPTGSFKASGTMVNTVLVTVGK